MLASRIINCYASASNTSLLQCAYGDYKKPRKNSATQRPFLYPKLKSVTSSVDNFLLLCCKTERVFEDYVKTASDYQKEIIRSFETYGVKNSNYRTFILNLSNPLFEVCDRQYRRDKNIVLKEISDKMFATGAEFYNKVETDLNAEADENFHNVDKLLEILSACYAAQSTKISVLQHYENACGSLSDEEKNMLSSISEDVIVNQELLLHIEYALNLLKNISKNWYYIICNEYNIKPPKQTVCQVKIVNSQLLEAKKHLAILLWGCL